MTVHEDVLSYFRVVLHVYYKVCLGHPNILLIFWNISSPSMHSVDINDRAERFRLRPWCASQQRHGKIEYKRKGTTPDSSLTLEIRNWIFPFVTWPMHIEVEADTFALLFYTYSNDECDCWIYILSVRSKWSSRFITLPLIRN